MKTIRGKIIFSIVAVVSVFLLVVGITSIVLSYQNIMNTLEGAMLELSEVTAARISHELSEYLNVTFETGCIARLTDPEVSPKEKQELFQTKVDYYKFTSGGIITKDGKGMFNDVDFNDRDYFQKAMQGETYISEPLISKVNGEQTMVIAAPLWKGGVPGNSIEGVVYFEPSGYLLNEIVTSVNISAQGGAYIINREGGVIAHKNQELVAKRNNSIALSKQDPAYREIAEMEQQLVDGQSGFGSYEMDGVKKLLAYTPIPETFGWGLGIYAPTSDFMGQTYTSITVISIMLVLAIGVSVIIAMFLSGQISKPVVEGADRLRLMAEGDLSTEVPSTKTKDETGQLLRDLKKTIDNIHEIIDDTSYHMGEIAGGNLTTAVDKDYVGEFIRLKTSSTQIIASLNDTMMQINQASSQVASGADQLANASQALSQGAVEQASSVEQLAVAMNEVSQLSNQNAEHANAAKAKIAETSGELQLSNSHMDKMVQSMKEINETSLEIHKIIKTIDDIAFQTNILSLNAAVEAARAGTAGKGFAVVADEVRLLASKSAEAAKNTAELIDNSIQAVGHGGKIVDETAHSLKQVVGSTQDILEFINRVAEESAQQNELLQQMTTGVNQISEVVQTNSATAQESAATSEELSAQAQVLNDMVAKFRLANSAKGSSPQEPNKGASPEPPHPGVQGLALSGAGGKY